MANAYAVMHVHFTFSTKNREKVLNDEIRTRLWPYMAAIANENGMKSLATGGVDDHAHMLLSLPARLSPARAMQIIKTGSSRWIRNTFPGMKTFRWQEGYGAFSISMSRVDKTIEYINNQEEHHQLKTFKQEYMDFLSANGVTPEEPFIWG